MKLKTNYKPTPSDIDWTKRMLKVSPRYHGQCSGIIIRIDKKNCIATLIRCPNTKECKEDAARFKMMVEMLDWKFEINLGEIIPDGMKSFDLNAIESDPLKRLEMIEEAMK